MTGSKKTILQLALLLLSGILTCSLPSVRQCLHYTNNATIQAQCAENKKHVQTFMPSDKEIYYTSNETLRPPTEEIPHPYYQLCPFDTHRDGRFCKDPVIPNRNRVMMIKRLFGAFLSFTKDFNLTWWMAHGALIGNYYSCKDLSIDDVLGWFYNENLLPWDTDVDIRILYYDLITDYKKFDDHMYKGRYLFKINPNSYYRGFQEDDVIDARFIDTTNGLYVDMLAMVYDPVKKHLYCKSPRYYTVDDLFPLKTDTFMGFDNVWFPNNPIRTMEKDYGKGCMEMKKWARPRTIEGQTYDIEFYKWSEEGQVFVTDDHPPSWKSVFRENHRRKKMVVESKQG